MFTRPILPNQYGFYNNLAMPENKWMRKYLVEKQYFTFECEKQKNLFLKNTKNMPLRIKHMHPLFFNKGSWGRKGIDELYGIIQDAYKTRPNVHQIDLLSLYLIEFMSEVYRMEPSLENQKKWHEARANRPFRF